MSTCARSAARRNDSTIARPSRATMLHRAAVKSACQCADCAKGERLLQRAAVHEHTPAEVPPIVYDVLRSPGAPLERGTRAFMEERFGHDFSAVRVHTDARASESARAVNAKAYTVGTHVVFGTGQYQTGTAEGKLLLAHELTHVFLENSQNTQALSLAQRSAPSNRRQNEISSLKRQLSPSSRPDSIRRKCIEVTTPNAKKTVRIALTIDDGPQLNTAEMAKMLFGYSKAGQKSQAAEGSPSLGISHVTWFIQKDKLTHGGKHFDSSLIKQLIAFQQAGGEIGIHSFHEKYDHRYWFPQPGKEEFSYPDIEEAMKDLAIFKKELESSGLKNIKHVRMPAGMHTELVGYLEKMFVLDKGRIAREIMSKNYKGKNSGADRVYQDFLKMEKTLKDLGLTYVDWDAESSGVGPEEKVIHGKVKLKPGRTDDVTGVVSVSWREFLTSDEHRTKYKDMAKVAKAHRGVFEERVDQLKDGETIDFKVLTHDTTRRDVVAFQDDVKQIIQYAHDKGVDLEFCTLAELADRSSEKRESSPRADSQKIRKRLVVGAANDPEEVLAETISRSVLSADPF